MPVSGRFTKGELTALENSWLSFEGAIGPNKLLYDLDKLLQTKGQGKGLQLYTNMLNEAHTYAEFRTLARTITSKEWTVSAFSKARKDQKAADIVREQIENLNTVDLNPNEENYSSINGFDQLTEAFVISGVLHGRHFGEVMWQRDGSTIFASEIRSRDPRQFQFSKGKHGYVLRHMTQFDGSVGEEMPPRKIMAFCHGAIDGNPYGFPLGRTLFWPQFFKKKGILFWLGFVERFAQPKIVGKYPIGTPPDQITAFNEVLQQLNQDIETSIPDGMMIEYLEAAQGGAITTFESLTAFMDAQISRAILGETGTSDQTGGGGSRARDQVADDQKDDVAKGVADSLSASFNRLSRWITELNVPGAMPPRIYRDFGEHEDLNTRASRDRVLFDMGYRLEPDSLIDIYGEGYVYPEIQGADAALIARFGVQGVQLLSTLLGQATGGSLPKENAVAILTQVFGLTEEQAGEMIPEQVEEEEEDEGESALDRLFGGGNDGEVPTEETEEQADADPAFAEISAEDFAVLVDKVRPGIVAAIAPWIDSIGGLVAGAETMEGIREQLIGLYPEMEAANFAEVLGEVMQTGDLIGRDEIADDELEFAEVLGAILPGTIDFAGKKKGKKKPKSPKCTAGKSHFCKTPTGRGSCVSTKKKCRYKPNGAAKSAADYLGEQKLYGSAGEFEQAGKAGEAGGLTTTGGGGGGEEAPPKTARELIDDQFTDFVIDEQTAREWLDARVANDFQVTDENVELNAVNTLRRESETDSAAWDGDVRNGAEKRIRDRESFAVVKTEFSDFYYGELDKREGVKNAATTEAFWLKSLSGFGLSTTEREKLQNTIKRGKASQKTIDKAKKRLKKDDEEKANDKILAKKKAKQAKEYLDLSQEGKRQFWRGAFDETLATERGKLEDFEKRLNSKNTKTRMTARVDAEDQILRATGTRRFDDNLNRLSNDEMARAYLTKRGTPAALREAFGGISEADAQDKSKIKRQYKKLAQKAHPDAGGSAEEFLRLTTIYEKMLKGAI